MNGGGTGKPPLKDRYLNTGQILGCQALGGGQVGGAPPAETHPTAGYLGQDPAQDLEQLVEIDKTGFGRQRTTYAAVDEYMLQGGAGDGRAGGGEASDRAVATEPPRRRRTTGRRKARIAPDKLQTNTCRRLAERGCVAMWCGDRYGRSC